jgi:hypothetical protein
MLLADDLMGMLTYLLARPGTSPEQKLSEALRLLCKHRSEALAARLLEQGGSAVRCGPFAGMALTGRVSEGAFVPKLLGCYEQELHPVLETLPTIGYEQVINVGCAEGFYAVGLARLLEGAEVHAFDIDPTARELCAEAARANDVTERVEVNAELKAEAFDRYEGRRTFVLCDIEGAEFDLLDPATTPALAQMDLLVEVHDELRGDRPPLRPRFEPTHEVTDYLPGGQRDAPAELCSWDSLDRLLAFWEWRLGGNHWLWLRSRARD